MRFALVFLCLASLAPRARAGVFGWFTSQEATWEYIQRTGGLKISEPEPRDGRWILPVEYDVHGTRAVTRQPTLTNSAPHTCRLRIGRDGSRLFLTVTIALAKKGKQSGFLHEVSLSGIPAGTYAVFYGGEPLAERALGRIAIPDEPRNLTPR